MSIDADPLDVLVVGAGIGGLAAAIACRQAGHRVTVLEQADRVAPVGAGITLAPNATSCLAELGVASVLTDVASCPSLLLRRRWSDGYVLGALPLGDEVASRVGSPYWHVHRADLHAALEQVASDPHLSNPPVDLALDRRVTKVAHSGSSVEVYDMAGTVTRADVVIGADGLHSAVRDCLFGAEPPLNSGDVAYRTVIPIDVITRYSDLAEVFASAELNCWLGPGRHLVHYPMRAGHLLNVLAVAPATRATSESWSALGSREELVSTFAGWDDRLLKMLCLAEEVRCWALYDRAPMMDWVAGNVALLGDACHAMLPYQAQGAAQAIEDAVAIGHALRGVQADGISDALRGYQAARHGRATEIQAGSRVNGPQFHLADGPEQEARDRALGSGQGEFETLDRLWRRS